MAKLTPPKRSKGDIAHASTKALLGSIPYAGNAAAEFFQQLVQPPLERRRQAWMESVEEALAELSDQSAFFERLRTDESFISILLQATQIALRTHQDGRLGALRNAVLNAASGRSIDESEQQIFLQLIDSFTDWHLRLLKLFDGSAGLPPGLSMGGLSDIIEHNFPELRSRSEFYRQLWRDLYLRGLVNTEGLNTMMTSDGLRARRTTDFGFRFLSFVSTPPK